MNDIVRMMLKLLIICASAAFCLGIVNAVTEPEINRLKEEAKKEALSALISRGTPGDEKALEENTTIKSWFPVEEGGETISYILYLEGKGYGGPMTIMASYEPDGAIINALLMDNTETPGIGKNAEREGYMDMFIGTGNIQKEVPRYKSSLGNGADAVSGATITFMGISEALRVGSDYVKGGLK